MALILAWGLFLVGCWYLLQHVGLGWTIVVALVVFIIRGGGGRW